MATSTNRKIMGIFLVVLAAFFGVFHRHVIAAHFGSDEMMNLYGHWQPPLWKTLAANVWFWSKTVRPMGAVYYLPLYRLFGLNPAPFALARCGLLFLNTAIFWLLAKTICRSWWIATLAAFPVAYQSNLGNLHYDGAYIYDALCGGFYFAALLYYLRCRRGGRPLRTRELCIFLLLYVCAVNAKEMAVSLPVLVLIYELVFNGKRASVLPAVLATGITALLIWAKTSGPGALTSMDSYRPVFTWDRFAESNTHFYNQLFYTDWFTIGRVLGLWGVLLCLGFANLARRRFDPRWLFLLLWVLITPLPIVFIPNRGGATLYIVSAGWAMLAAFAARAFLRLLGRQPFAALPPRAVMTAGLTTCIAGYWVETKWNDDRLVPYYLKNGEDTQQTIAALASLGVKPSSRSSVVFLNHPFPEYYDTLFIAALTWRDPSIEIWLQKRNPAPEGVLARAEYVFDYVDGRFTVIKGPRTDTGSSRLVR